MFYLKFDEFDDWLTLRSVKLENWWYQYMSVAEYNFIFLFVLNYGTKETV